MQKRKREGIGFSSALAGLVQGSCASCTGGVLPSARGSGFQCPQLLGLLSTNAVLPCWVLGLPGSPQSSCPSQLSDLRGPSAAAACGVRNPMALGIGLFLPHPCRYPGCCEGCGEAAKGSLLRSLPTGCLRATHPRWHLFGTRCPCASPVPPLICPIRGLGAGFGTFLPTGHGRAACRAAGC